MTVTSGLLNRLDDAELEAVLAHELTHIRNGDVRTMVIAVVIAGIFAPSASWCSGFGSTTAPIPVLARRGATAARPSPSSSPSRCWRSPMRCPMIRFALSRSREFLADAGAVELTKNSDALISALPKIEGRGELPGAPSAVMELCFDNPREGFGELFDTHPTVDSRVAALVKFAGGDYTGPIALGPSSGEADDGSAADQSPPDGPWSQAKRGPPVPADSGPWGPAGPSSRGVAADDPSPPPAVRIRRLFPGAVVRTLGSARRQIAATGPYHFAADARA